MALKKMRAKSHGGLTKRIQKTGGKKPKLLSKRVNVAHRMIKKSRERVLRARRKTTLSNAHDKFIKAL